MFEDLAKNLVVPNEMGMKTVLVLPKSFDPRREADEQMDIDAPYIQFKTKDLTGFLKDVV